MHALNCFELYGNVLVRANDLAFAALILPLKYRRKWFRSPEHELISFKKYFLSLLVAEGSQQLTLVYLCCSDGITLLFICCNVRVCRISF